MSATSMTGGWSTVRSLIIIEVEHGEDTDAFSVAASNAVMAAHTDLYKSHCRVLNSAVRVDLPTCFALDTGE